MKIKLIKFRDDLIPPARAHYNDAGIDCFAQEDFSLPTQGASDWIEDDLHIVKVPLGFGLIIPDGYVATIRPRSSMNAKGIVTQIGTIDSGYRGEISAIFINLATNKTHEFKKGDKICQIVVEPVVLAEPVLELGEERGIGGFGSSGR